MLIDDRDHVKLISGEQIRQVLPRVNASALDSKSEKAIQSELRRIAISRTTLTIAHRLSTIVDADQILVMESGRIVERGTHRELLARAGTYEHMWTLQQQEERVGELQTIKNGIAVRSS